MNKAHSEHYVIQEIHHVENYEEFSTSTIILNENEDSEEAIVNKMQQSIGRYLKIGNW